MAFEPRNPDYEKRVADSFQRQQFMATIGAKLVSATPGKVAIQLPFSVALGQQHGYFHGGVIGTIADNCCGYAAFTLVSANDSVLTAEYKINLLNPGAGELLIGRGEVLKPGRLLSICRADVFSLANGKETHCASAQATIAIMANHPDKPSTTKLT